MKKCLRIDSYGLFAGRFWGRTLSRMHPSCPADSPASNGASAILGVTAMESSAAPRDPLRIWHARGPFALRGVALSCVSDPPNQYEGVRVSLFTEEHGPLRLVGVARGSAHLKTFQLKNLELARLQSLSAFLGPITISADDGRLVVITEEHPLLARIEMPDAQPISVGFSFYGDVEACQA